MLFSASLRLCGRNSPRAGVVWMLAVWGVYASGGGGGRSGIELLVGGSAGSGDGAGRGVGVGGCVESFGVSGCRAVGELLFCLRWTNVAYRTGDIVGWS